MTHPYTGQGNHSRPARSVDFMLKPGFYWGWLGMCFVWALFGVILFHILKQLTFEEEE